ncbi:MAG: ATP-binding protein [Bacteroidota bacterium]
MSQPSTTRAHKRLLDHGIPQFEQFIESREKYVKALEKTVHVLKRQVHRQSAGASQGDRSFDRLVAAQSLSETISTATEPEHIVEALIELTRQIIPVIESNVFLIEESSVSLKPLAPAGSEWLGKEIAQQREAGVLDWVLSEKRIAVVPDTSWSAGEESPRSLVLVPLVLRSQQIGVYGIHANKRNRDFSNEELQLLSLLACQAVAGVENWRTHKELVRANEELKMSRAQMVQAAKLAAIGELAAGIAHEIKNPLQVLMLHLELVQAGKPLPNWVEMFSKQVKRLSDLTLRLMNFARNASEDVIMDPICVNRTLEDIVAMVQHDFEVAGVEFDIALQKDLPLVGGNANYLQQVFLNLLINSRDAMPEGGKISIATLLTGYFVSIQITDTGHGISREIQEKIFVPFFTTKGEKGTGLGLAVCSKIISQHKGEIRIESAEGEGTVFTIYLPVWRGPNEPAQ